MGKPINDLNGKSFGRLRVIGRDPESKHLRWLCECTCGRLKSVSPHNLISGKTSSCGCLQREAAKRARTKHGQTNSPTWKSWAHMIRRCESPTAVNFDRYGGRGIGVCDPWHEFLSFLADMGERPSLRHSIERNDNDGNYEPGNCRWATPTEQSNNRRSSRIVSVGGVSQTMAQWSKDAGIKLGTIWYRLDAGWTPEMAVSTPAREAAR